MTPLPSDTSGSRLADGIGRAGFRKWYERELLSCHAYMLLCFLSVIGLLGSLEAYRGGTIPEKLTNVLFVLVCAGVGLWALRRYLRLLMHAEVIANQANCPDCRAYGRFKVVAHQGGDTKVCCRKCNCSWVINDSE